jgi:hypothetical protein
MISASPLGWEFAWQPGGLAHINPLLKTPGGRRAITRLAARQVRRRHRIAVIRCRTRHPPGSPVLITRTQHHDADGMLLQYARNHHPAGNWRAHDYLIIRN